MVLRTSKRKKRIKRRTRKGGAAMANANATANATATANANATATANATASATERATESATELSDDWFTEVIKSMDFPETFTHREIYDELIKRRENASKKLTSATNKLDKLNKDIQVKRAEYEAKRLNYSPANRNTERQTVTKQLGLVKHDAAFEKSMPSLKEDIKKKEEEMKNIKENIGLLGRVVEHLEKNIEPPSTKSKRNIDPMFSYLLEEARAYSALNRTPEGSRYVRVEPEESSTTLSISIDRVKPIRVRLEESNLLLERVEEEFEKMFRKEYNNAYYALPSENGPFVEGMREIFTQLISASNVKKALATRNLLETYDPALKFKNLPDSIKKSNPYKILAGYEKKMKIAASTKSIITKCVMNTVIKLKLSGPFDFAEGLIVTLRRVHSEVNNAFREAFRSFSKVLGPATQYVHSGSNLIVLLASTVLSFCADTVPGGWIEQIKTIFVRRPAFMAGLQELIQDPSFVDELIDISNKLSDMDFLFMTENKDIDTLESTFLISANESSALALRQLMCSLETRDLFPCTQDDQAIRPYRGNTLYNGSGLSEKTLRIIRENPKPIAVSQTSNWIDSIHIYLNRIKMIPEFGNECGEFIDLCIGSLENPYFSEKLLRYLMGDYYTLDTLLEELEKILKEVDDKTEMRVKRYNLLRKLKTIPEIDDLFLMIGRIISNEPI